MNSFLKHWTRTVMCIWYEGNIGNVNMKEMYDRERLFFDKFLQMGSLAYRYHEDYFLLSSS